MFSIINIARKNRETFYNYDTKEPQSIWIRYTLISIACLIMSVAFSNSDTSFATSVMTAQSILAGFSFSVLFFLISERSQKREEPQENNEKSLESEIRGEKTSTLSTELFYNVSYFNVVSLSCLCFSLAIIAEPTISLDVSKLPKDTSIYLENIITPEIKNYLITAKNVIFSFLRFFFYFTLFESIITFARTVKRVIYYFEKKLL